MLLGSAVVVVSGPVVVVVIGSVVVVVVRGFAVVVVGQTGQRQLSPNPVKYVSSELRGSLWLILGYNAKVKVVRSQILHVLYQ